MALAAVIAAAPAGCGGGGTSEGGTAATVPLTSLASGAAFYDAPYPADHRRDADGRPSLAGFPNPDGIGLVADVLALTTADADGFGVTTGAFFRFSAPLDPASLPAAPLDTLESSAPVFLIDVDPASPERGRRYPLHAGYQDDAGPLGATNLLVLLPLQGIPLREGTRYAAGVTRALRDANGQPLAASPETRALVRGERPAGLAEAVFAEYREALAALAELGRDPKQLAALTVFTTGHPMRRMQALADHMETIALPEPVSDWQLTDTFDDFCVVSTRIDMPVFQRGEPPFFASGGDIAFDGDGVPLQQGTEPSRLVVTLPRRAPSRRRASPRWCSYAPVVAAIGRSSIAVASPATAPVRSSPARGRRATSRAPASRRSRGTAPTAGCATCPGSTSSSPCTTSSTRLRSATTSARPPRRPCWWGECWRRSRGRRRSARGSTRAPAATGARRSTRATWAAWGTRWAVPWRRSRSRPRRGCGLRC
ncbi:MAG: hypothetical protein IPK07_15150 [Deltaproteobacteria bacterium]|nr:hypothetical protein [Deltaproteobacteria bacterium]